MLTLVASALAGGDCIDDADVLRTGGTVSVLGCMVKAPSTLGTFLRSFRWGHVRQLDRVSRQLLARAWAAGAGPGDSPLTIDLDSTICETYGLAKEGARHHGYTGKRGYHPLLAVAAGTGDLLDVARIETGELSVAPAPADVATLVDEARSRFQSGGGRTNLVIDLSTELPLVMADGRRIIQVLNNLLTNAARHSHEASAIGVSAVREGYHVAVSVTDEGRGIAAERLPHLFRKFSRIDGEERGRDIAGSGLGLGARFTFTIPAAGDAAAGVPRRSARPRRSERERERILAVDDDPQTLRYVRDALTNAGYTPVVTGDPQEATSLVRANDPHLVLLDLMLPGTDGIELMGDILDMADVPVIFLSAYGQEEIIARAFEMGADDYVVKPFSPTELVARIKAALRKREAPEWAEPSEPYVFGELTVDYAERRVTLAGRPVQLTAIEYGLLFELSANAGRVMTYDRLLQRVWGLRGSGDSRRVRTAAKQLRRKLGDDANNPTYILNEPRVGYRMEKGEAQEREEA